MGFLSICTAVYDYQPQSVEELEIKTGELLYILEQDGGDNWWKARKKAAEEDEDEPEGLIPNNYVEAAKPIHKAKALFDYTRQTDEEVSFSEDMSMDVYDVSDPDWTLVGVQDEYGFAPANYIEISSEDILIPPPPTAAPLAHHEDPSSPMRSTQEPLSAAAAVAEVLSGRPPARPIPTPPEEDEEERPDLPRRPPSQSVVPVPREISYEPPEPPGIISSPPYNRVTSPQQGVESPMKSPGGFHLYNISEMVSVMGRRKKMPTTLGLNIATGTIMISPEKTRDGPTQEWTAEKLSHYSIEGKHVFLELIRPSKSLDLHAGAKDTAQEIVSALGEIAGAHKAEGIKEVYAAASSGGGVQKKGVVLYDFMAQGDDEVTVAVGDEVVILDDEKSEEWWNIRRLKNGSEGVMPASYIEVTGIVAVENASRSGVNAGRSVTEQNRLEEERLAREAVKSSRAINVEKSIQLPERGSSLADDDARKPKERRAKADSKPRSKPDPKKTRVWTDRSGDFKVEAQFIGIADGKIHLHKINGVKIAVPVAKMSAEDIEYVEKVTKESVEDHIPVADLIKIKRKNQAPDSSRSGASVEPGRTNDYDWFDFFLAAGIGPHQCERYTQAMVKDSMDESVLPDITTDTLRALGLKEGDALKVMKFLDQKFGRNRTGETGQGGIFSGAGGALHNNTRRGRPETNRSAGDIVNASAFEQGDSDKPIKEKEAEPKANGFDDDAWQVKPSTQTPPPQKSNAPPVTVQSPVQPPLSQNMQDLSLLDKPLEPTPAAPPRPASQPQAAPQVQTQQTGANPAFFSQVGQSQPTTAAQRQRPAPPQQSFTGSTLLPPPPRPLSAPQNPQQNQFGLQPLQPQLTGLPSSARPAGPNQSLDELTAQRMQQQYLQPQPTGYSPMQAYGMNNGLLPQVTGFPSYNGFQQPFMNGNASGSPFADSRGFNLQPGPAPGSLNSVLPPALTPQKTGFQPQLQLNGYGQGLQPQPTGFGQLPQQNGLANIQMPPVPPMPQQSPAPLVPQKTGPAPNIRFGLREPSKLAPQPTGRRANLAQATPQNPFGF